MSQSVDIGIEERKNEAIRNGKSALRHTQRVFYITLTTHKPHFIDNLILFISVGF